jgi:aspartate aminotransferase
MNFSQRVYHLSDSLTLKINAIAKQLASQGRDIINFSAGEPDFDTPAIIKEKAKEAIDKGFTKYTPVSGIPELKDAIIARYKKKYKYKTTPDTILVSAGAKQAVYNMIDTLCGPDDEVIIPTPYWVSYPEMVKLSMATPVFVDTSHSGYIITPRLLQSAITEKTKLLILNSPVNPTGVVYMPDHLKAIAEILKKRKIMCIADEIYDELVDNSIQTDSMINSIDNPLDTIIVANGVSKTFAMTGWRLGYSIASPEIIKQASKIQAHTTSCASSISQYAALSAFQHAESFINEMRSAFDERRNCAIQLMKEIPDITFPEPKGSFYLFFNIKNYFHNSINNSLKFAEYLLQEHNVAVVPGVAFGDDNHLRLSYTLSLDKIKEGISRIKCGLTHVRR